MNERYGDIWVCQDCYFAHHYGAHQEEFSCAVLGLKDVVDMPFVQLWYAGEDDEPVGGWHEIRSNHTLDHNREPLGYIDDCFEAADNTCSNHYYGQKTEDFDVDEVPCDECGQTGWEDGLQDFSWRSCDGCHSSLGGSRYRLSLWKREEVTS